MLKKIITCFLIVFFSLQLIQAHEKKLIKYEDYIQIIKEKLPELKQNENQLSLAENNVYKALALHDFDLSAYFEGLGSKTYPDGTNTNTDYSSGFKTGGEIGTTLPSGTRITLGGEYQQIHSWGSMQSSKSHKHIFMGQINSVYPQYMRVQIPETISIFNSTSYDPRIKIKVSQPLIYNWFGYLDRYAKKDARMKLKIERLVKIENDRTILNYYQKLYFYWIQYLNIQDYLNNSLANSRVVEKETLEKFQTGLVENDDYQQSRYSVFKYREQVKEVSAEIKKIEDELGLYFDIDHNRPDYNEFDLYYQNFKSQSVKPVDFEETTSSKILNLNKENLEYLKTVSLTKSLPQLNLYGNLDIKFHKYYNIAWNKYGATQVNESFNGHPDFVAGIEFKYSLGNHQAFGDLKEARIQLNDLLLEYEKTRNSYKNQLKQIINYISMYEDVIDIKIEEIDALSSSYQTQRKKYNQGRLDLKDVLDTDNTITNERIELMKVRALLISNYLNYFKLIQ